MAMAWIWTAIVLFSVIFSIFSGNTDAVGRAALDGSAAAIKLAFDILGPTCLWAGVMEVMRRGGLADKLAHVLRPVLTRLFPSAKRDKDALEALSANVSANLLGIGNAATPPGIRAAEAFARTAKDGVATDDLCMLVVINAASIQIIPATVAAVRSAAGAKSPFDILPAVWVSSICSVAAGIGMAKLLKRVMK